MAILKAIKVARESGDHICVAFSLLWLYRIRDAGSDQCAGAIVQQCRDSARELNMSQLVALTDLMAAVYFQSGGQNKLSGDSRLDISSIVILASYGFGILPWLVVKHKASTKARL